MHGEHHTRRSPIARGRGAIGDPCELRSRAWRMLHRAMRACAAAQLDADPEVLGPAAE